MNVFKWRSLRSAVKQHFAFLYARQWEEVRAERDGVLSSSGCIVFRRDAVWVMASRHMDDDFVELAFVEPTIPLDWFDFEDAAAAAGASLPAAPVTHTFPVKAPILEKYLPLIEEAAAADRQAFLLRLVEARERAVSENDSEQRRTEPRQAAGS